MTPNFWWLFERHIATDSSRDPLTRACVTDWTSGGLWACASVAGNAICALGRHWQAWFLDLGVTRVRVAQLTRLFVRSSTENVHLWNKILYFIFFAVVKSNLHSYNVEFVSSEAWISLKTKKNIYWYMAAVRWIKQWHNTHNIHKQSFILSAPNAAVNFRPKANGSTLCSSKEFL